MADMNLSPILFGTPQTIWGDQFNTNFSKIATHAHGLNTGAQVSLSNINIKSNIRADSILANQFQILSVQNLKNCVGTEGGDLKVISERGTPIRITAGKYINFTSDSVGGFTGDYVSAGAQCIFTAAGNTYKFTNDGTILSTLECGIFTNANITNALQTFTLATPLIKFKLSPDVSGIVYTMDISTAPSIGSVGIVYNTSGGAYNVLPAKVYNVGTLLENLYYDGHVFNANKTDEYPVNVTLPTSNREVRSTVNATTIITRPIYVQSAYNLAVDSYELGTGGDMFSGGFMNNHIYYAIGFPGSRDNYLFVQSAFEVTIYPNSIFLGSTVFNQHRLGGLP